MEVVNPTNGLYIYLCVSIIKIQTTKCEGKKMKPRIIIGHQHTSMKPTIRVGTNKLHLEYNAGPNKWGSDATMAERAETLAAQMDIERKLQFYENWAEAIINGYFVFSDGSEIEVPVK